MHARLRSQNNLFILRIFINRTLNSPCLADEIAGPRPDVNIKVAAFTVSEKSITCIIHMENLGTTFCSDEMF